MSKGVYGITEQFEQALSAYTGAPYVVTLDNQSNALFLALYYEKNVRKSLRGDTITIPNRTYPSVPCEIIHAGLKVKFDTEHPQVKDGKLKGPYQLIGSHVWDAALRFTYNMYQPGQLMCCSFTGGLKTFKMGSKAGCILTDDPNAAAWFKRARFSGRREIPYADDNFDMTGWNFYLNPELSTRGMILMTGFYKDGKPLEFPDVELPYPDLSKFTAYTTDAPKEITKENVVTLIKQYLEIKGTHPEHLLDSWVNARLKTI
jgi:hypothetical protein